MGCISAYGMGSLHVLEGTINAERYIKVLEQHMLPSRQCVFHQEIHIEKSPGAELACLQSRSFTYRTFGASLNKKNVKDDHKLFSSWKPISGKNGTKSDTKTPETHNLDAPDIFKLFWKVEEILHHGKHAPVPTILRPVVGIKFEISSFYA